VLAVVGPSGSGKSSLLRAGVAASLRAAGREVRVVAPGRAGPTEADAVARTPIRTVLLVDQLEEVFAPGVTPEHRTAYLDTLVRRGGGGELVVALRADRTPELSGEPELARLLERGWYLLNAMDAAGLRAAIERPARQAGLLVEPGLVDLLLREVLDEPGALPLLSHSLVETWNRREGRTLTVDGYLESGGVRGSIAQSAEAVYGDVPPEQRDQLRDLLMRLVAPGAEGEPTRIRISRDRVVTRPEQERLVELLVGSRLLTSDDGNITLAHEALAREWPRLRGWLDDDVEGQRIRHHLSASADAWHAMDRPDSELYRGVRLARALEWSGDRGSALTEGERQYLQASSHHAEAQQQGMLHRARAQARLIRRLRIVLSVAAVLLILALITGGLAAIQSNRAARHAADARDAADSARQAAISADARRVGARSQLTDDISLSLLLGAAGARLDDSPETRMNLVTALQAHPTLVRSAAPEGGYLNAFDVSPDGRWIASSDDQNRMHLYDASTNRLLRSYDAGRPPAGTQAYMVARFSRDSRQLAVSLEGSRSTEPVRLLDPKTMQPTRKLDLPGRKPVWGVDVQFSAEGRFLAATVQTVEWPGPDASEAPGFAVVWDLLSPSKPAIRVPTGTDTQGMALSPDGRTLYTGQPLTAYDVATGERIWRREEVRTWYSTLDVNTEGTLLAVQTEIKPGKNLLLVDASTGATVHTLHGHRDTVSEVRFSPDGTLVGSVSEGGELIVWDSATGRPLERWHTFDRHGVGFGPDNDLVYGGGVYSMLRTWDLSGDDTYLQRTTRVGGADVFTHADFSPDGQQVAYSWLDGDKGWVRFVDVVSGQATSPARAPVSQGPWASGAWNTQGQEYVATCVTADCVRGPAIVLDPVTGSVVAKRKLFDRGDVWSIAYVDGDRSLLVGGTDVHGEAFGPHNKTLIVDAETLQPRGDPWSITAHNVIPIGDGSKAMVHELSKDFASVHWQVIDFSTDDLETLSEGDLNLNAYAFEASPDGSTVAVAGDSGEIVTIDVLTGAQHRQPSELDAPVLWLNYSDDGELLVSGAADGRVSLWDATTLDPLGTVKPPHHGHPVAASAQFIGDTHDVAIASYDGKVYRWQTDLDHAIDFACQMAGRNLTDVEWKALLPAQPYQSICPAE
jgi:WD40 repeat protein